MTFNYNAKRLAHAHALNNAQSTHPLTMACTTHSMYWRMQIF